VDGKEVDSGTNKLGVIMGDHSKVGINSSISPGVKIGPYSVVGAGVRLQEDLEPGKILFQEKESLVAKENTITVLPEEKRKLTQLLKKYKQTK
jgi:bifunctional UDP-N-acetylglucosamine pyrophosphorylase/glucosamine-1-phosphate N-acetyltransferase